MSFHVMLLDFSADYEHNMQFLLSMLSHHVDAACNTIAQIDCRLLSAINYCFIVHKFSVKNTCRHRNAMGYF